MLAPRRRSWIVAVFLVFSSLATVAHAGLDARFMRYPDVSASHVAFAHAGDIWVAPLGGGLASRLSTPPGEESFPRFSPDGRLIAFSANYDGNLDIYVLPIEGGVPQRLTHHPAADRVLDWTPDGRGILFSSGREAGRDRYEEFFIVPVGGGLPEKLPIPYGSFGTLSADGTTLAYTTNGREFSTWKRYRGGWTSEIWLFNLKTGASRRISDGVVNDFQPMFTGNRLIFLSDRGASLRANLWSLDLTTGATTRLTDFTDLDCRFPSAGPAHVVFEHGGALKVLELATGTVRTADITVQTDRRALKPRTENVSDLISGASVSPSGKRLAVVARGDVFSVPAEEGVILNLTRSPGTHERSAAWSPDGKQVAYWTDRTGEYELALRPADGSGTEKILTSFGPGFRYELTWSPDSKRIAFVDQAMRIQVLDVATGRATEVDRGITMFEGGLQGFSPAWSPDSRWLAWSRDIETGPALFIWDARDGVTRRITSGFTPDQLPAFDPDGKYLFFLTNRHFAPVYSDVDNTWVYPNTTQVAAMSLRQDVPSPIAPKNDREEGVAGDTKDEKDKAAREDRSKPGKKGKDAEKDGPVPPPDVTIDFDGLEQRVTILPPESGNLSGLVAASGKLVWHRHPRTGSGDEDSAIVFWDFEEREEKTIVESADAFELAAGGEKLLVLAKDSFHVVDIAPDQKLEKAAPTSDLEAVVDPPAEWRQIFNEAWRLQRDFFYDRGLHGVDWAAMRTRYGALVENAVTRADLNVILGELIGELNSSHAYRWGGDLEQAASRSVGMLGCDFSLDAGRFRITRILQGAPWETEVRSPLAAPGLGVKEGDWLLAINGAELDVARDPWAALDGLANRTIELTVNGKPSLEGARTVVVTTLDDESRLRQLAWVERNRRHVDERSNGRIAYVYVQDTGREGQSDLVRMFAGQFTRPAMLVDERFNSGGQIPDRFVELLNRPITNYWAVRDGKDWQWPPVAHRGPKAMLINGWSGSGGDCFPFYFREAGLGPLIGRRTWGGLIGISGSPDLMDGGSVTVPTFAIYSPDGSWIIENHGVEPDIEVVDDPALMQGGADPQLDRAIDHLLAELERDPPKAPVRPAPAVR